MYDAGLVSRATVLLSGDYKISDAPSTEEDLERFTRELMLRDPNLFQIPAIRKVAGYTDEVLPPNTVFPPQGGMGGAGPPPPPAPPTGISETAGPPIPLQTEAQNAPGGPPAVPSGVTASISQPEYTVEDASMFVVANAAVLRALELVGKRLLSRQNRATFSSVPQHDLHTCIAITGSDHAQRLLGGAWDHLHTLAEQMVPGVDAQGLGGVLNEYCIQLMSQQRQHHPQLLFRVLQHRGFFNGRS
jgi:hypothetical protein